MERLDDIIQQKTIEKLRKIDYAEFEDVNFLNDLYKASDYSAEVLKNNMMTVIRTGTTIFSLCFIYWDECIKTTEDNEKKGILISTINHCNNVIAYTASYFIFLRCAKLKKNFC